MGKGISVESDKNVYGSDVLVIRKARGKLTLKEIEDYLRYERYGQLNGVYAILINAQAATCGGAGWGDETEPKGDVAELCLVLSGGECPICVAMLPGEYCPHCGESLRETKQ